MANTLCCTHLERSDSPETPNARQTSLPPTSMNFALNTPNEYQSEPSPEIAVLDGTELQRIFVAASLPDDHPHAIRLPRCKPRMDDNIIKSPSFSSKIKRQLSRKSLKSVHSGRSQKSRLGRKKSKVNPLQIPEDAEDSTARSLLEDKAAEDGGYDDDAYAMSSREVIDSVDDTKVHLAGHDGASEERHAFGSVNSTMFDHRNAKASPSIARSLEWLRPILREYPRSSSPVPEHEAIVPPTCARAYSADVTSSDDILSTPLPQSMSSPDLLHSTPPPVSPLRRSRSTSVLDLLTPPALSLQPVRGCSRFLTSRVGIPPWSTTGRPSCIPPGSAHTNDTMAGYSRSSIDPSMIDTRDVANKHTTSNDSLHLQNMRISQHLRTASQISARSDDASCLASNKRWNFHHRERSSLGNNAFSSIKSRHLRGVSSPAFGSGVISWKEVDTSSSVYSGPSSSGRDYQNTAAADSGVQPPYEISYDSLRDRFEWPLPSYVKQQIPSGGNPPEPHLTDLEVSSQVKQSTSPVDEKYPSAGALRNESEESPERSVQFVSVQHQPSSDGSTSSSTSRSNSHSLLRPSKFLELFTPPKRNAKKRHSVFNFLHSRSHRRQARSVSTPLLTSHIRKVSITHDGSTDGPADDPGHPTVQYEMTKRPGRSRSVSMNDFTITVEDETGATQLAVPNGLQRRPTPADYERRLSVVGDDRRRPSSVNVQNLQKIDSEDRRESLGLKRTLSRATPLFKPDNRVNPLMQKALQKHQQEKAAMFRTSSKRSSVSGISGISAPVPVFGTPFGTLGSSLPPPTPRRDNDLLDPLDAVDPLSNARRSQSMSQLHPPGMKITKSSITAGASTSARRLSTQASIVGTSSTASPVRRGRIRTGTALASWSRYPSHTRGERCGSAGPSDSVFTRDFAFEVNPEDMLESKSTVAETTPPRTASKAKTVQSGLPKSRSMTFGSVVRYYSQLFKTQDFAGKGRRTSISTSGKLEYPELEMIAPIMPAHPHHHYLHSEHVDHIKEHVKEEGDKLFHITHGSGSPFHTSSDVEDPFKRHKGKDAAASLLCEPTSPLPKRTDTMIGPMDGSGDDVATAREGSSKSSSTTYYAAVEQAGASRAVTPSNHHELALDGVEDKMRKGEHEPVQQAQHFSDMYKSCVQLPTFSDNGQCSDAFTTPADSARDSQLMPPPPLKPPKPRLQNQPKTFLHPNASVRKYPSVTVIDDKQGHWRSVSFISVKSMSSSGSLRASTKDLLQLVQEREAAELEALLRST